VTAGHRILELSACLCGENILSFNSRAQNRARKEVDSSEHLWTHPDRGLGIIEGAVSRAYGDAWLKTNSLPALRVPTVITPGEWNVLVNPLHPQFSLKWVVTGLDAYTFDARLLPVKKGIRSRRTRDQ